MSTDRLPLVAKSLALVGLLLTTGCSLDPKAVGGLTVRLMPAEHRALSTDFMSRALTTLASGPVNSIDDLSCFSINVRGGAIPTANACGGAAELGFIEGPQVGIDTPFEVTVPVSDGIIFEAYGTEASNCTAIGEGNSIYKVGQVTLSSASDLKNVIIPVAINTTNVLSCTNEPYTVFFDDFLYGSTNFGNLDSFSTDWISVSGFPALQLNGVSDVASALGSGPTKKERWTGSIDNTEKFTRVTAKYTVVQSTPFALVEISNSANPPTTGLVCAIDFNGSPNVTIFEFDGVTIITTLPNASIPTTGKLVCERTRLDDTNQFTITAAVYDASGNFIIDVSTTISQSGRDGDNVLLGAILPGGPTKEISFDSILIEQASSAP